MLYFTQCLGWAVIVIAQVSLKSHVLRVDIMDVKTSETDNEIASIPLGF